MQEVGTLKAIFSVLYISVLARNCDIDYFDEKWAYKQFYKQSVSHQTRPPLQQEKSPSTSPYAFKRRT